MNEKVESFERYLNKKVKIVFSDISKMGVELRFSTTGFVISVNSETLTLRTEEGDKSFVLEDVKRIEEIL